MNARLDGISNFQLDRRGITYMRTSRGDLAVYLRRVRTGTITRCPEGFVYVPTGQSGLKGEPMPTEEAVKLSLEGDL